MNILGLIPARAGSKRAPGKNIRLLSSVPLIAWTFKAAVFSRLLDKLVVSTDDIPTAVVADQYGIETVERPAEFATDEATAYSVMLNTLDTIDETFDFLCYLQPTSPFRTPMDIDNCIWAAMEYPPAAVTVSEQRINEPNGAVYVGRVDWLRETIAAGVEMPFDTDTPHRITMEHWRSLDIDTEEDWQRAEGHVALMTS